MSRCCGYPSYDQLLNRPYSSSSSSSSSNSSSKDESCNQSPVVCQQFLLSLAEALLPAAQQQLQLHGQAALAAAFGTTERVGGGECTGTSTGSSGGAAAARTGEHGQANEPGGPAEEAVLLQSMAPHSLDYSPGSSVRTQRHQQGEQHHHHHSQHAPRPAHPALPPLPSLLAGVSQFLRGSMGVWLEICSETLHTPGTNGDSTHELLHRFLRELQASSSSSSSPPSSRSLQHASAAAHTQQHAQQHQQQQHHHHSEQQPQKQHSQQQSGSAQGDGGSARGAPVVASVWHEQRGCMGYIVVHPSAACGTKHLSTEGSAAACHSGALEAAASSLEKPVVLVGLHSYRGWEGSEKVGITNHHHHHQQQQQQQQQRSIVTSESAQCLWEVMHEMGHALHVLLCWRPLEENDVRGVEQRQQSGTRSAGTAGEMFPGVQGAAGEASARHTHCGSEGAAGKGSACEESASISKNVTAGSQEPARTVAQPPPPTTTTTTPAGGLSRAIVPASLAHCPSLLPVGLLELPSTLLELTVAQPECVSTILAAAHNHNISQTCKSASTAAFAPHESSESSSCLGQEQETNAASQGLYHDKELAAGSLIEQSGAAIAAEVRHLLYQPLQMQVQVLTALLDQLLIQRTSSLRSQSGHDAITLWVELCAELLPPGLGPLFTRQQVQSLHRVMELRGRYAGYAEAFVLATSAWLNHRLYQAPSDPAAWRALRKRVYEEDMVGRFSTVRVYEDDMVRFSTVHEDSLQWASSVGSSCAGSESAITGAHANDFGLQGESEPDCVLENGLQHIKEWDGLNPGLEWLLELVGGDAIAWPDSMQCADEKRLTNSEMPLEQTGVAVEDNQDSPVATCNVSSLAQCLKVRPQILRVVASMGL